MIKHADSLNDLLAFLQQSPTPFHAVEEMRQRLLGAGFRALDPAQDWDLRDGHGYFVERNDSSIVAFRMSEDPGNHRLHMIGAHTDSPCLRVKPNPEMHKQGYQQLGVEVYGGPLLHPWFDRDLSLAGRVVGRRANGQLESALIDFKRPIACIPSLAIHLNREANKGSSINAQTDLPVLLGQELGDDFNLRQLLQEHLQEQGQEFTQILDYELSFYDTQAPAMVGWQQEFVASARLDNLLSCYVGLQALLQASSKQGMLLVCNDHEEVGSQTAEGAQGNFLMSVLQRMYPVAEKMHQVLHQSVLVSTDNAHGVHPNFANKHDDQHGPKLNAGPVIKINANQRYATNALTSSLIRVLAEQQNVPVQAFVVRSDMGCGSTIGPITAAQLGIKTIDLGMPTFAMHSIRETAGSHDVITTIALLQAFYETNIKV
ncbi:MAG TPA: M18 family aminopeptidase [Oceanospirillaceae bacterium]|nr:M18 family aminopeptidase [Oceanospirillaceae bacterium]